MMQWRHFELIDSLELAGPQGFKFVWRKLEDWFDNAEHQMMNVFRLRYLTHDQIDLLQWPQLVEEMWPFVRSAVIMEGRDVRNYQRDNGLSVIRR